MYENLTTVEELTEAREIELNKVRSAYSFTQLYGCFGRLGFINEKLALLTGQKQNNEQSPQLQQADVSGWQELELVKPNQGQKIEYEGNLFAEVGTYIGEDEVLLKNGTIDKFEKWKPA